MHCTSEVTVIGDQGILQTGIWGEAVALQVYQGQWDSSVGNGAALDNVSFAV